MVSNFLLEYDRLSSLSAPGYENSEIVRFLEKAQIELVTQLYQSKQYMLIDDLFVTYTYSSPSSYSYVTGTSAKYVDLNTSTTRYMFYVASYSDLTRTQAPTISSAVTVQNQDITKNELKYYLTSAFNTPIFRYPKAMLDGAALIIIPDGYTTISKVTVDYLSQPKALSLSTNDSSNTTTCELKTILHDQVVSKAVEMALIAIDPNRAAATIKLNQV